MHIVLEKVAFWLHIRKIIEDYAFCIFHLRIFNHQVKESVLEGKILNQRIHQIPSDKILQTNFRVKKKISTGRVIANTFETIALLTAILYFVCFNQWKRYVLTLPISGFKKFLELSTHPYALMIDGGIVIGLLGFFIYALNCNWIIRVLYICTY